MRKPLRRFFCLLLCLPVLTGCALSPNGKAPTADPEAGEESRLYLDSMDTFISLTAYGSNREAALEAAQAEILRLDALWSIGAADSEIAVLNRTGSAELSADTAAVVQRALELYEDTEGCFDITVSPLMELWGFYSKDYRVPGPRELAEAMEKLGSDRLRLDVSTGSLSLEPGQAIDLGGIAKGYASQRLVELWRGLGLSSGLVSLGGNIQCVGSKPDGSPWRVGIQDPNDPAGIAAVLTVTDQAVITSGGYERFFTDEATGERYQHIIDPSTGYPVESGLASVSIITSDGALGDGLSTALYIMGLDRASDYWRQHRGDFEVIFIDEAGKLYITQGLEDSVSSQRELHVIS